MIKTYRKVVTVDAEQFDESASMIKRYKISQPDSIAPEYVMSANTEDIAYLRKGDWIVTGEFGDHWPIRDEVFRSSYKEVHE
ncbi:hypothetical protein [Lacticaseibacillus pantheris]|uniref:hypothetical protein n=1 Tax=Lacticaseibacillus pantheris TaxID=171523 RepID=UPI00265AD8B4|nr:hypothetical protein [Lacticaseibacillus pantheris]WKF86013.1 hypothetical protein QY874_05380 [Lacticaseibacillus pantheris]